MSGAFVFSGELGGRKPWRPDSVSHRWTRLRRLGGLPNVSLHDLRHFAATSMLAAGIPVNIVAGRLGHARAATTLNVYAHFTDGGTELQPTPLAECSTPQEGTVNPTAGPAT